MFSFLAAPDTEYTCSFYFSEVLLCYRWNVGMCLLTPGSQARVIEQVEPYLNSLLLSN